MGAALTAMGCNGERNDQANNDKLSEGDSENQPHTRMCPDCFNPEFLCSRCDLIQCSSCASKQHRVARLKLPEGADGIPLYAEDISLCDECFAEKKVESCVVHGGSREARHHWHFAQIIGKDANFKLFRPGDDSARPNAVHVLTREEYREIYSVVRKLIANNTVAGEVQKQILYDMVCNVDMNLVRQYRHLKGMKADKKAEFTEKEIKQFAAMLMPTQPMQ